MNKNLIHTVVFLTVVLSFGYVCFAPVGNPGVPTSSRNRYQNTGVTSQDSYGQGQYQLGNDIITGNVKGNKYFRGFVPYGSAYEFRGQQGTSDLFDFYRRAASVPSIIDQQQPERYYLPSRSVTSTQQTNPAGVDDRDYGLNTLMNQSTIDQAQLERLDLMTTYEADAGQLTKRPMTRDMYDVRMGLQRYMDQDQMLPGDVDPETLERRDESRVLNEAIFDSKPRQASLLSPLLTEPGQQEDLVEETRTRPTVPGQKEDDLRQKKPGVYEQMMESLQMEFEERVTERREQRKELAQQEELERQQEKQRQQETIEGLLAKRRPPQRQGETAEQAEEVEQEFPDKYDTLAVPGADSFNRYMSEAEELMDKGMYYKAADAYSIASAYQDKNPLPYVGRCIALFAAGEYMSSSYYLSISLRIFGQLPAFEIDIKKMIGDDDLFDSRIAELVELQIQSDSPQLNFLKSYIYLNTGQAARAKEAIQDTAEKLPDDQAVEVLKKAIMQKQ